MYELKIYREVFVMKTKNDAKLEEELTCRFKIDMRNLKNSDPNTQKSLKFMLNGLFLIKVFNFWTKKLQRSYIWWHSRLMQNLKENWFVLSKMTWRICQIFVHMLKNSNIILESKMAELNQNKNRPDRPDAIWKLYLPWK